MTEDADYLRSLGYQLRNGGWHLVNATSSTARPRSCKACRKFDGHPDWDGLCAGCMYFGDGDPHGLGTGAEVEVRFRAKFLPEEKSDIVCNDCYGYMATGPDRLCDGCAWEAAGTSLSFSEWRDIQDETYRRLMWLRGRRPA